MQNTIDNMMIAATLAMGVIVVFTIICMIVQEENKRNAILSLRCYGSEDNPLPSITNLIPESPNGELSPPY